MATTRIIPMHRNKGKTIAQCLRDRTEYAKNPEKTEGGELVSAFACDPRTVEAEFLLSKREYKVITGRAQERDVIAYQVRQSFRPGEISPEEANRVGHEFARRFLKENHAFIVATHVDKAHIHNHIIWNSTSLDCTRKFRNFWGSTKAVQRLSDTICVEHGLSIVENPKPKGKNYAQWLGEKAQPSQRDLLRSAIDTALGQKPADFHGLLDNLRARGWEIKEGKTVALRGPGEARFKRLDTLGEEYGEAALGAVLSGQKAHALRRRPTAMVVRQEPINLLVDIQAKLSQGKGLGYERWAMVFNLKQMAQAMNYLSEHGLTDYDALAQKAEAVSHRYHELSEKIKGNEKRMTEISVLKTHIIQYLKTREVYKAYRQAGYSKQFLAQHEQDILLHKAAKRAFDELGVKKLPTVRFLQNECTVLLEEKKRAYADYRKTRDEMRELLTVKANVDRLLGEKAILPSGRGILQPEYQGQ